MKCILALIALTLVPINLAAQEPEKDECSDVGFGSPFSEIVRCLKLQNQKEKDAEAKLAEAKKVADEAKEAGKDWNNLHSTNPDQQITGVTDTAKDVNSHVNNNPLSEVVTDKAVSLIDQFEHRKNELLSNTANTVRSGLAPQGGSPPSFNTGEQHELVEPQGSLQQQFENRKQVLLSTPSIKPVPEAESTRSVLGSQQSDLEGQFQSRKEKLLKSASTVTTVSQAVLALQAAEQERIANEAKRDAAYRAEVARQGRDQAKAAEDNRIAEEKRLKAEKDEEDREERREARREAREQQAAWDAIFGRAGQYFPSALPQDSYGSGYANPYIDGLPKGSGASASARTTSPEYSGCTWVGLTCSYYNPVTQQTEQEGITGVPAPQSGGSQNGNNSSHGPPAQSPSAQAPPATAK